MVYVMGYSNPFTTTIGFENIDPERQAIDMEHVNFLRPDQVDPIADRYHPPTIAGFPVDPTTMPRKLAWKGRKRSFPDVEIWQNTLLVSERVRDVVERFEPGAHQFIPVDIYHRDQAKTGAAPFVHVYWLIVGKRLECISASQSRGGFRPLITMRDGSEVPGFWNFSKDPNAHVVFDSQAIAGHHMWVAAGRGGGDTPHLSDELADALKAMTLVGAGFMHYDEA